MIRGLVFGLLILVAGGASAAETNKCGCHRDSAGTCFCDKSAKCGCPGDCEPKGCEEKRDKQLQKEIETETKKAAEADRKRRSASPSKDSDADTSGSTGEGTKAAREPAAKPGSTPRHRLTDAQLKELAKLLDGYLHEHLDARSKTGEEIRNELQLAPH